MWIRIINNGETRGRCRAYCMIGPVQLMIRPFGVTDMTCKKVTLVIGDKVAFSAAFLRSTGQFTGKVPKMRGTITAMTPMSGRALCAIAWDNGQETRALDSNLARVGSAEMSAN